MNRILFSAQLPKKIGLEPVLLAVTMTSNNSFNFIVGTDLTNPIESSHLNRFDYAVAMFREQTMLALNNFIDEPYIEASHPQYNHLSNSFEECIVSVFLPNPDSCKIQERKLIRFWHNGTPRNDEDCFKSFAATFYPGEALLREEQLQYKSSISSALSYYKARVVDEFAIINKTQDQLRKLLEMTPHYCNICGDMRMQNLSAKGDKVTSRICVVNQHNTQI